MSERDRPRLIATQHVATLKRFRALAAELVEARSAAEHASAAELTEKLDKNRARLEELQRLADEVFSMAVAVADHPEVIDLPEASRAPPPTVHDDTPDFVLRDTHGSLRDRLEELLPDLDVDPDAERHDTPTEPCASPSPPSPGETTEPSDDAVPLDETLDEVTGSTPTDGSDRRCPHCGAGIDSDIDSCPSCGEQVRAPIFAPDSDSADAVGDSGQADAGGGFGAFVRYLLLIAVLLVAFANVWPPALDHAPVACEVPWVQDAIPCRGPRSGLRGLALELVERWIPSMPTGVDSAQELVLALTRVARQEHGTIQIAAGTYVLDAPITLSGDVALRGQGMGETIIRLTGPAFVYAGDQTWTASNLTFARSHASTGDLIVVADGNVRFDRVAVVGARGTSSTPGAGMLFAGTSGGTVRDCSVTGNTFGIVVTERATPTIVDCTIDRNAHRGVSFHDRGGGVIRDSTISNNGYASGDDFWQGVGLEDEASPSVVDNDVRRNAGVGIQYRDRSGGSASGNRITGNGWNIRDYGSPQSSTGGIAIGTNGTDQRPTPTLASNVFDDNYGGEINDYR